jgi:NAD+ synthase (glutamine-hydrolysing)
VAAAEGIAVLVGAPQKNEKKEGKDLFNAAYFIVNQKIQQVIQKTCLPTYDVFDENRYFEASNSWDVIEYMGKRIAVNICEDIWNLGDNPQYTICPMDKLILQDPHLMINLSASPFDYKHLSDRQAIIKANVLKYRLPMMYCNAIGSQTEIVFDGSSMVFDKDGAEICRMASFAEDVQGFVFDDLGEFEKLNNQSIKKNEATKAADVFFDAEENIAEIYLALKLGIKDYFEKMGFSKAILGSSGGIDSAVTLAIAVDALGADNVTAILMPSAFSSTHSVDDAVALSKNLQNPYQIVSIASINDSFLTSLEPLFSGTSFGLAEENIQSRTRGNLLMAIANKFGYILLNTSNKSELATGYGTLYGDMAGGLSVLGDCYKMQVYALAKYINKSSEIIPWNIITKPPSAELRPNQKDSDSLPEYEVLDKLLYAYIEKWMGPTEIKSMGFDHQLVDEILKKVNTNEYKRNQFCPIIRISPKAFGIGRRMPIVGKYLS